MNKIFLILVKQDESYFISRDKIINAFSVYSETLEREYRQLLLFQ